jgi:hypothetical protein
MLSDYGWKALHAALITFTVLFVGFVLFWAFRGFLPASRIIELPVSDTLAGPPTEADFNFYFTTWCPYSQSATPAVRSLNTLVQGNKYGNATVRVNFIDCETESAKCRVAGVDGYPSYSLVTPQKTFRYAGPPKTSTYEEFLISALGPKKSAS